MHVDESEGLRWQEGGLRNVDGQALEAGKKKAIGLLGSVVSSTIVL